MSGIAYRQRLRDQGRMKPSRNRIARDTAAKPVPRALNMQAVNLAVGSNQTPVLGQKQLGRNGKPMSLAEQLGMHHLLDNKTGQAPAKGKQEPPPPAPAVDLSGLGDVEVVGTDASTPDPRQHSATQDDFWPQQ